VRYAVWNGPGPRPQDTFYAFKPPDAEEWHSNRAHETLTWEELTSTDKWTIASIDQVEVMTGWHVLEPVS
jgi:hypothetical protein